MAFVEIYPNNRSGRKYGESYFESRKNYNDCMEWYEDGNEIVVMLNTEKNTEAVYERLGGVLCLNDRFGIYCNVDVDDDWTGHNELIRKMLVQEATADGFPEKCPPSDKPKRDWHTYLVDVDAIVSQSLRVEAANAEDARAEIEMMIKSGELYEENLRGNWCEDGAEDTVQVRQVQEWDDGNECHTPARKGDLGLHEYTVKIKRTCDVSVMAEDPEQAQRIGEALAAKESAWVYQQMQEAMAGCGDEFFGVGAAQEYCDFAMTADECKRILGE